MENTASSNSIAASCSCLMDHIENTTSLLVNWCVLGICCIATGIVYRVITSNRTTCYIAPSLRLFFLNILQAHHFSFQTTVFVTSVIGLAFLPRGSVLMMITLKLLPLLPPEGRLS
jgi:hypothetical protein